MMFFVGVQLLQRYGYVSSVNWDKLANDTSTQIQHWASNIDVTNGHSLFHTPVSGGLALGFLADSLTAPALGDHTKMKFLHHLFSSNSRQFKENAKKHEKKMFFTKLS
jgi:hypothetical protein